MGTEARRIAFEKYEGLGNDFLVIDAAAEADVPARRAVALCDRHFGIGADGVLLALPPRDPHADVRMLVVNADGSVPEMCGNGARCLALHVARGRGLRDGNILLETSAGVRSCAVSERQGDEGWVTVDMGLVRLGHERELDVSGERLTLTVADAGNPHAVLFGTYTRDDVERLGSGVEKHRDFAFGTNVEFVRAGRDGIHLVVWERGVGITLACGTGACAAAAVACAKGLTPYGVPLQVRLPGGTLQITVAQDGQVSMRGPARHVFSGVMVDAKPASA
jgi:diaminopimelate epimerase